MTPAGLFGIENKVPDLIAVEERTIGLAFDSHERTTEILIGERNLRVFFPAIREIRRRCGQQDDLTTDPRYFIAANTLNRRVAAVLIRLDHEPEACVLFFEHCKFGIGLGVMRGGGLAGENCVAGPKAFRLHYIKLAAEALLRRRWIHGVSISLRADLDACLEAIGPQSRYRIFSVRNIQYKLPLESTYGATLAGMGPRTRRSLAGKRRQLEGREHVAFLPSLDPAEALEAMLKLQKRSLAKRTTAFYRARYRLLLEDPNFFCMGLRLPDGTWLSVLSGYRGNTATYIDLQMNDMYFKQESISAVMRAFMLEHEIARKREFIHFIGGTSLLLGRYCEPNETCIDVLLRQPCFRAMVTSLMIPRLKPKSFYTFVKI